jgi:hypothetical protein
MEARAEKVLEELRRLLGQFRHRSYSGLRGQEFLMTGTLPLQERGYGGVLCRVDAPVCRGRPVGRVHLH